MSKGVLYDATKCIGCRACQVACKQWNELPAEKTSNSGTYENPPRMTAYTFTKINFTELEHNGEFQWVTYDEGKCIGCRYCMVACPFGIPNFEWDKPLPWIRKCTFCADRQGAGLKPACVTTCPTSALKFGERDELIAEAQRRIAEHPDKYVNHVYGENEVGGTSWLYLSPVPFEEIGFPILPSTPVTVNVERAMAAVPPVLVGVAAAMAGIYWLVQRQQKIGQKAGEKEKQKEKVK